MSRTVRELVVEVVVALTQGDECGHNRVAWREHVVVRRGAPVVGERVDTEGAVLHEVQSHEASVEESTLEKWKKSVHLNTGANGQRSIVQY